MRQGILGCFEGEKKGGGGYVLYFESRQAGSNS